MEKKIIISGQQPKGVSNQSYEMNGSHTYGNTSSDKVNPQKPEEASDHYDRDETCNAHYDKNEKHG